MQRGSSNKPEEIFITNLNLLGFDPLVHCKDTNIIIDKNTFTTRPNCIKAFEVITYFLFNTLDKTKTRRSFQDIWPITCIKDSLSYRNRVFAWLSEIRPGTLLQRVPLRKSYFTDCRGESINKIIMAFSTIVLENSGKNNNIGQTLDPNTSKSELIKDSINHLDRLKETRLKTIESKKRWSDDRADLVSRIESKKQKIQPRRYSCSFTANNTINQLNQQYSNVKAYNERKEREERERIEKERLEQERLEQERLEQERLEQERMEQERLKRERIEKERIEKERIEKERLERERREKERIEKERLEKERLEKERLEKERLEQERLEQERLEQERLEQERLEQERLEQECLEKEQLEKERLEKERLEKEQLEKERLEKERLEREQLELERRIQEQLERERLEKEQLEQERREQERREQERREQERREQERREQERREQERREQERREQERREQERLERERLERERLEQERLEQELHEQKRLEQELLEQERRERERIDREQLEQEHAKKQLIAKERLQKERAEKERINQERIKQELIQQKRIEQELAEKERLEEEQKLITRLEKERSLKQEKFLRDRSEQERRYKEIRDKESRRKVRKLDVASPKNKDDENMTVEKVPVVRQRERSSLGHVFSELEINRPETTKSSKKPEKLSRKRTSEVLNSPESYTRSQNYPSSPYAPSKKPTNATEIYLQVSHILNSSAEPNPNYIIPNLPPQIIPLSPSQSMSSVQSRSVSSIRSRRASTPPPKVVSPSPANIVSPSPANIVSPSPANIVSPSPAEIVSPSPAEVVSLSPARAPSPLPLKSNTIDKSSNVNDMEESIVQPSPKRTALTDINSPSKPISSSCTPNISYMPNTEELKRSFQSPYTFKSTPPYQGSTTRKVYGSPMRTTEQLIPNFDNYMSPQRPLSIDRKALSPFPTSGTPSRPMKPPQIIYSPQRSNIRGLDDDDYDFDMESVIDIQEEEPPEWTPMRMKTPKRF